MLKVHVVIMNRAGATPAIVADYTMDHDDQAERRVLGEQCRNAFEGGQWVYTYPVLS